MIILFVIFAKIFQNLQMVHSDLLAMYEMVEMVICFSEFVNCASISYTNNEIKTFMKSGTDQRGFRRTRICVDSYEPMYRGFRMFRYFTPPLFYRDERKNSAEAHA